MAVNNAGAEGTPGPLTAQTAETYAATQAAHRAGLWREIGMNESLTRAVRAHRGLSRIGYRADPLTTADCLRIHVV